MVPNTDGRRCEEMRKDTDGTVSHSGTGSRGTATERLRGKTRARTDGCPENQEKLTIARVLVKKGPRPEKPEINSKLENQEKTRSRR